MAEILSVHTMQVWRTISQYEEKEVCERYKDIIEERVDDKGNKHKVINNPGIKGVNQITLSRCPINGTGKYNIQINLFLNVGKMIGKSRVAMTELRKKNVENFIEAINNVLDDKLHLHKKNRDASDWNFKRIDVGGDYHIGTGRIEVQQFHIQMLHKSFFPYNARNYNLWSDYYDQYPEKRNQSIRVSNGSATYNIYSKSQEIPVNHPDWDLTPKEHEESDDVIRVEKQIEGQGLKVFGGNKLSRLANEDVTFPIMGSIVDDIAEVFGSGDYVSFFDGQDIIQSSSFPETDRKMMALIRLLVNQSGYVGAREWLAKQLKLDEAQSKAFVKECRKKIESLGISVIELSDKDAAILGKNRIPSLGKMMQERYGNAGNRKSRGRFAAIIYDEKSKRYKCNPTLHRADGSKYRTGIAGSKDKSRESVEIKIIRRIGDNMVENFKSCRGDNEAVIRCYGYAREELMNYKGTVATANTIRNIDNWMERIDDEVAKLKGDVGNV